MDIVPSMDFEMSFTTSNSLFAFGDVYDQHFDLDTNHNYVSGNSNEGMVKSECFDQTGLFLGRDLPVECCANGSGRWDGASGLDTIQICTQSIVDYAIPFGKCNNYQTDPIQLDIGQLMQPEAFPKQSRTDCLALSECQQYNSRGWDEPLLHSPQALPQDLSAHHQTRQQQLPGRRGLHVRDNPDMQRTAREGAAHWAAQRRLVRAAWAARAAASPAFLAWFSAQADAAQGRIKSKQECLLRSLQMAAADGLIAAGPFVEDAGFFGWNRFAVVRERAGEFRAGITALFPAGFKGDALKELFRRAGLVPENFQWEDGWRGDVAFVCRPRRTRK